MIRIIPSTLIICLLSAMLLVALPGCAGRGGQIVSLPAPAETPEQITEQYFKHIDARDWVAIAKLLHPESVKVFRGMLLPLFESEDGEALFHSVFVEKSPEEVKKLNPHDFLAPYLQKVLAEKMIIDFKRTTPKVLGSIAEGANVQHVLVRMVTRSGSGFHSAWKVLTFVQDNNRSWRLLPENHLISYTRALIARARVF